MQEYNVIIKIKNEFFTERVAEDTRFLSLAEKYQTHYKDKIVLASVNNGLRELNNVVDCDCEVEFVTMTERDGKRAYRRSVTLLLQKAVYNLWLNQVRVRVLHSLGESYYCELEKQPKENGVVEQCSHAIDEDDIVELKKEMLRLVEENHTIEKCVIKTEKAREMFRNFKMHDKELLMTYRRSSSVNIYLLDGFIDYYYGYMVPSTSYLKCFDLKIYEDGFVLMFPNQNSEVVEPLNTSKKLYHTLDEAKEWSRMLGVGTIGALNEAIAQGRGNEIILLQEALMEQRIGNVAAQIAQDGNKKFIMIAGPSSSGKTSFSNRLSIQLSAKGLRPHPIALDDYYVDREKSPRDENGNYDFECLECIDVEQFNIDMTRLLNGETVDMPSFNFKTGKREYRGKKLKLEADDVLVIEGIHGLNDKLSYSLPSESKFRIYLSALAPLSIDEHNPLPTTDGRLLRRMVRDARTRNTPAQETLRMWYSVRRGEEKYIFPFQESADVMFNSALVYEIAVLKTFAEPLLFQIPRDCEEYKEAKRLLKFLDYFLALPTEGIAQNSLAREFIGGSCFNV
ncbi:MAG: nucleoside kinase [Agathobacter sp.]|nr:nucleoside kinase [Agathobacter sp.]